MHHSQDASESGIAFVAHAGINKLLAFPRTLLSNPTAYETGDAKSLTYVICLGLARITDISIFIDDTSVTKCTAFRGYHVSSPIHVERGRSYLEPNRCGNYPKHGWGPVTVERMQDLQEEENKG
jgi:hypothetical protein